MDGTESPHGGAGSDSDSDDEPPALVEWDSDSGPGHEEDPETLSLADDDGPEDPMDSSADLPSHSGY
eukprot:3571960-Lingulodinium_polyedra.AAC.1